MKNPKNVTIDFTQGLVCERQPQCSLLAPPIFSFNAPLLAHKMECVPPVSVYFLKTSNIRESIGFQSLPLIRATIISLQIARWLK